MSTFSDAAGGAMCSDEKSTSEGAVLSNKVDRAEGVRWHDTTQYLCAWPLARTVKELLSVTRWLKDAQKMFALGAHVAHLQEVKVLSHAPSPSPPKKNSGPIGVEWIFSIVTSFFWTEHKHCWRGRIFLSCRDYRSCGNQSSLRDW